MRWPSSPPCTAWAPCPTRGSPSSESCTGARRPRVRAEPHAAVAAAEAAVATAATGAVEGVVAVVSDRVGLSWRGPLAAAILSNLDRIDVIELMLEDFIDAS